MMYNPVHTGANIQLGGLNEGLYIVVYQPFTDAEVNKEAMAPIASGIAIDMISLTAGFISITTVTLTNCYEYHYLNPAKLFIIRNNKSSDLVIT